MAERVALNLVPALAQPAEVRLRLAEAVELQTRNRQAQEAVAAAQEQTDEAEKADVHAAAARARAGEALGTTPVSVKKSREQLETSKRNAAAIALALEGAESDLAATMVQRSDEWLGTLDDAAASARVRAATALGELEAALSDLTEAASAGIWLRGARSDQRFDRPVPQAAAGMAAETSRRVTASSEALTRMQLLDYLRELVTVPAPAAVPLDDPVHADLA